MRSKTLSSDFTILRKDLTRFAPVWLGLCAYLVIWYASIIPENPEGPWWSNLYEPIAPIFAPILAICIFGYLCDPRECHTVHSLPIRRERLFLLHTLSANLMFLIPTAIFCFLTRDAAIQGAMYRFLFLGLEFFFLFSIGVLCMMLTGRKIGAALLYIFIQSFSFIAGIIIESLYLPMLPGVYLNLDYTLRSPTLIVNHYADFMQETDFAVTDWTFIAVIGVLSLAILAVSMLLYRKRRLEHAGDLLAVGWLNPFFAACSAVTGGSAMVIFEVESPGLLLLGCAIGYFAYWMLSKKSGRVFTLKNLGGFVCLMAVVACSMYLTHLDPLDRVYHVPEADTVEKVTLGQGSYDSEAFSSSEQEVIADVGELHLELAKHYADGSIDNHPLRDRETIHLTYYLKNGQVLEREYECADQALLDRAAWYLSQPEARFQRSEPDFASVSVNHHGESVFLSPHLFPELKALITAECREGRMFDFEYGISGWIIAVEQQNPRYYTYLSIPVTAVDTIAFLKANCAEIP